MKRFRTVANEISRRRNSAQRGVLILITSVATISFTTPGIFAQQFLSTDGAGSSFPAPSASSQNVPQTLSLQQAIQLAISNNVNTQLATERINEAKGLRTVARAGLLPDISGTVSQRNSTLNLAALGFTIPSFPLFLGPFNVFDARLNLAQKVFDLSAIRHYQSGKQSVRVASLQEGEAKEQVALETSLAYLNALRTAKNVETSNSNLTLANALLTLAQNQKNAGIATGVDVTRAEARAAQETANVARAQTEENTSYLQLLRVTGLPLDSHPTLIDELKFAQESQPALDTAVSSAKTQRPEVQVAEAQVKVAQLDAKSARAAYLPSVDVFADYGSSGVTPATNDFPTRDVGVRVNIPIFNGGATNGRVQEAVSRQRQAEIQLADVQKQVEQDVRDALQRLATSADQVRAADQSVTLAERELQMARDRFAAGVGDNIEVITAQTSLADARDSQVTALAQYNAARINLASALGRAQDFRW